MITDRFIQYIQFEKRYSPHTVKAYSKDLEQFAAYLQGIFEINDLTEANHVMIRSWIVSMIEQDLSARSVNRKISTLKTYYRFMLREKLITENPLLRVTAPRPSQKLPVFVEQDKMMLLLDEVEFGEGFGAFRDRLIIEMLYGTGMRLSELISLKDADIDLQHCSLKVTGKRNKQRIIPFSNKLRDLINAYITAKDRENMSGQRPFLFLTNKGQQLYPKFVYRVVNAYLNKVTTISKKSPHILRHTFATHMLNNGADLNAIKEILGHASLSATQVYTHNTIEKLKSIYNQAHPKA